MFKEFKEFAVKGNVMDMAVGIIIGAAFGKVVSSLVKDVLMPPLGILIGGVDFTDLEAALVYKLSEDLEKCVTRVAEGAETIAQLVGAAGDRTVWFTSPEDTVLRKLEWFRRSGDVLERQLPGLNQV